MLGCSSIDSCRSAITSAFPELVVRRIRLNEAGWDNIVAEVNDEFIFRFPRRPQTARQLAMESQLLPELSRAVSLPIPCPEFVAPGMMGYRRIPGDPLPPEFILGHVSPDATRRMGAQLGTFLCEVHKFSVERAVELGVPHATERDSWMGLYTEVERRVFPLLTAAERAWAQHLFESFLCNPLSLAFTPVLLHGDLGPDHILFDRHADRITGIIDFGDARISDPGYDLQLRNAYGEVFWEALLERYLLPIDPGFDVRLMFYTRRAPFHEILYGLDCDLPEHIAGGLASLRRSIRRQVGLACGPRPEQSRSVLGH